MVLRRPTSDSEYRGRTKAAARRCQKKQEEHWAAHGVDDASPLGHTRQKPHGTSKVASRVRNVTKTTRRATTGVPKAVNKTPNEARRGRRQAKDSYRLTQRRRSNVDRNGVLEDEDYDDGEEEEEEGEDEEDEEDDDDDGDEEEEDEEEDEDEEEEEESASDNEYVNSDIHIPGDVLAALTPKFDELKKLIRTQDERAQMRSDANAKEIKKVGQILGKLSQRLNVIDERSTDMGHGLRLVHNQLKGLPGQYERALASTTNQLVNGNDNDGVSAAARMEEVPGTVNPNDILYHGPM